MTKFNPQAAEKALPNGIVPNVTPAKKTTAVTPAKVGLGAKVGGTTAAPPKLGTGIKVNTAPYIAAKPAGRLL